MFMLYALVIAVALGFVLGGRLGGLERIRFHWAALAIVGLAVQIVLFSGPVTERIGDLGPPIYVASTVAVLTFVLRNARIAGLPIVALGAASNLAAIVANGGYMPADPGALAALGKVSADEYSNSVSAAQPMLGWLTDVFAMPRWVPFANVFSLGDVIIAIGVVVVVVAAMREGSVGGPTVPGALLHPDNSPD